MNEFHRDLLFLLHDVARLLRVEADKRARVNGMTRAQWAILIWLERQPGISQKELSEILEVEPITVARLIDRLEARGMVERRPDPRDRRIWRLHLLPPAHNVLHEIDEQRTDMTRAVTSGITEESIETMTEALLRMKATLTQESHAARRGADAPGLRGADAPGLRGAEAPGLRGAEAPGLRGAEARSTEAPDIVTREAV